MGVDTPEPMEQMEQMEIEWLILADAAEVSGGKLYLLGGGFDSISVAAPLPQQRQIALAVSISVPWFATNEPHTLVLELVDEDGNPQAKAECNFEVGRPPGAKAGQRQRIQLALPMGIALTKFGGNAVVGILDGVEMRRVRYSVRPTPELERELRKQSG